MAGKGSPSKHAFRWVKGPTGWAPNPIGDSTSNDCIPTEDDGDIEFQHLPRSTDAVGKSRVWDRHYPGCKTPLCDQATVDAEADSWAALWKEAHDYECSLPVRHFIPRTPVLPSALRKAASTFPVGAGLGADNIAPRALNRLSDEAIQYLCKILSAMELLGSWASALRMVLIVLLPRPDGGRRPACTAIPRWAPRELLGNLLLLPRLMRALMTTSLSLCSIL